MSWQDIIKFSRGVDFSSPPTKSQKLNAWNSNIKRLKKIEQTIEELVEDVRNIGMLTGSSDELDRMGVRPNFKKLLNYVNAQIDKYENLINELGSE